MRIDVHVHIHADPRMDQVLEKLNQIKEEVSNMSPAMQALTDQVKANTKVVESAKALIQGFASQVEAVKEDPIAIQALVDEMKGEDQTLSDAVVANTPAPPPVA